METIQTKPVLSNEPNAVRKRINREHLREKRRQEAFVNGYMETKYPNLYVEAITIYQTFKERYPDKYDITKTYYYRKWQRETKKSISSTVVLPSIPAPTVASTTSTSTATTSSTSAEQGYKLYVPHLPVLSNVNEIIPEVVETIQEGQQTETQQSQERVQQVLDETQELLDETQQFLAEISQSEENETQQPREETVQIQPREETVQTQNNDLFSGMSLQEMDIAAQEIVRAIQSDQELMDIVENFDLPDSVWNNELSIPDYVLEGDLEW